MSQAHIQTTAESALIPARPPRGLWTDAWVRLRRNKLALGGGAVILGLFAVALLAGILAPRDPTKPDLEAILEGPGWPYLLGTDALGRDVLSRLIYGAQVSMTVGVFAQVIYLAVGLPIGALAGMLGGRFDNLLMRFVDVVYAFPDLLLIILLRAVFGGSLFMIFLAIGLVHWTTMARLVRGQFLALREREFVTASRSLGATEFWIVTRHLLPNSVNPLIVAVTFGVPQAIFAEAALSYIGIGVTPPTPSWGSMVQDGYQAIFGFPHLVLFPALAIAATMLSFTFLGDGLRDALDPRSRR
ncbi:MAG: ABC transporter permease [Chloroflexi bacterium]|nr:ABC transporter permease [Chloroflexota bacterium]